METSEQKIERLERELSSIKIDLDRMTHSREFFRDVTSSLIVDIVRDHYVKNNNVELYIHRSDIDDNLDLTVNDLLALWEYQYYHTGGVSGDNIRQDMKLVLDIN